MEQMMAFPKITIYTKKSCQFCVKAKNLLENKGVDISTLEEIRVDLNQDALQEMMQKTNRRTVPQIWIGDRWIGGFDDLSALDKSGELNKLLNN